MKSNSQQENIKLASAYQQSWLRPDCWVFYKKLTGFHCLDCCSTFPSILTLPRSSFRFGFRVRTNGTTTIFIYYYFPSKRTSSSSDRKRATKHVVWKMLTLKNSRSRIWIKSENSKHRRLNYLELVVEARGSLRPSKVTTSNPTLSLPSLISPVQSSVKPNYIPLHTSYVKLYT